VNRLFSDNGRRPRQFHSSFRSRPGIRVAELLERRELLAAFTPGDIVVERVGDGTSPLGNASAAVFLDEYTPGGTLVQSLALPSNSTTGFNKRLTIRGGDTSEGFLALSVNGGFLFLAGFDSAPGAAALGSVNRTIARVDSTGQIDTQTVLTSAELPGNPTTVVSTNYGSDVWAAGSTGNVVHFTAISPSSPNPSAVNNLTNGSLAAVNQLNIFGGQLYASSTATNFKGVDAVGTGLPTSGTPAVTRLPGLTDTSNPSTNGFYLADLDGTPGPDTLYVADNSTGLSKYSLNGGTWVLKGSVPAGTDTYQGLTATVLNGTVTLYATRNGNALVTLADTSGYNGTFSGTPTQLGPVAGTNMAFRGVALAPVTPVNSPPTLDQPTDSGLLQVNPGEQTVGLTGITDGDGGFRR